MATFELRIYGQDDEIVKTFARSTLRWGVFLQAVGIQEEISNKSADEQVVLVNDFVKSFFPEITEEELKNADAQDVVSLFLAACSYGEQNRSWLKKRIRGGVKSAPQSLYNELLNASIIIAGNYKMTPFELFAQDTDDVIMLYNYLSESGEKEQAKERQAVPVDDGFWDF